MLLSIEPNLHLTRTFLHKPQQIKQEWAYTALFVGRKKFVGEAFIHKHRETTWCKVFRLHADP